MLALFHGTSFGAYFDSPNLGEWKKIRMNPGQSKKVDWELMIADEPDLDSRGFYVVSAYLCYHLTSGYSFDVLHKVYLCGWVKDGWNCHKGDVVKIKGKFSELASDGTPFVVVNSYKIIDVN
jgi:hypothetical protein